jgi:adenine-specific DNA-methyltransferase
LEREERLNFSELSVRSIAFAIRDSYVAGKDLILGIADSHAFLKTVPDQSVKPVVTSPPYNIGKVYEERVKLEKYLYY